jgi:hypothetical protein
MWAAVLLPLQIQSTSQAADLSEPLGLRNVLFEKSHTKEALMRLFNILAIAATVAATAALIPQKASADRVCRQECSGPVCQERCVETEGREDRRDGREDREGREERREQRNEERDRAPAIELRVPGGGVEIGR